MLFRFSIVEEILLDAAEAVSKDSSKEGFSAVSDELSSSNDFKYFDISSFLKLDISIANSISSCLPLLVFKNSISSALNNPSRRFEL